MPEPRQEAGFNRQEQSIKGATYVVTGDVSEFGRKVVGDRQFFGVLGRGKEQVAYAKVSRSEEHTSELQSPCNLECRLLLEKKKALRPTAATTIPHISPQ